MYLDLVSSVLDDLAQVTRAGAGVPGQTPTPCDDFDLAGLRRHLLGGIGYFTVVLADSTDSTDGQRPDPRAYTGPDGADVLAAAVDKLAAVARSVRAEEFAVALVPVPELGGTFPGEHVLGLLLAEVVVHGWDLARATSREWLPDPAAAEAARSVLSTAIRPEYRGGAGMPFAPEVPVDAHAPALDRLLGFVGRVPS